MMSLKGKILHTMTKQSDRDKQIKIGPSDISKQCEMCLARKIGQSAVLIPESEFHQGGGSLATWLGTAFHEKLERDEIDPTVTPERKLPVATIKGYGTIRGTADRYDSEYRAVVDYKGTTKTKLKKYQKGYILNPSGTVTFFNNTLLEYYIQLNLYGVAVESEGDLVETVAIFFVPRDSSRFEDCDLIEFPYNRDIAFKALDRAEALYHHVRENGLDGLESDPDCFDCMRRGYA